MGSRKLAIGLALGFAAGVAASVAVARLYGAGGFLRDSVDTLVRPPFSATKALFYVAALLILVALPLGVLEWRAERRFLRRERELRASRPADAVTRYEGPEGRGFLFDGPQGRTLLLEPAGGLGEPRLVELPPTPPGELREAS